MRTQFHFNIESADVDPGRDFVVRIPNTIRDREDLFDILQRSLALPAYFGRNWDALADVLTDLSWIDRRNVVLIHEALPNLPEFELQQYIEVLAESMDDWQIDDEHELKVVFPSGAHDRVLAIANGR